jgi:hypothetical protein
MYLKILLFLISLIFLVKMLIIQKNKLIGILFLIIILLIISFSLYFYYKQNTIEYGFNNQIQKENIELFAKISRLYLVPDEEPTIATVSNPELLKDQSFFTLSEKGDKVFIFIKAGRAVLYRPSIDKIIEIVTVKNNLEY